MQAARRCQNARAFTLTELLIVISIIALLIAILLPAVSRAREIANRAKCLSNARQLSMAWLMYANDNKGHFPLPGGIPIYGRPNIWFGWMTNTPQPPDSSAPADVTTGMLWPYLQTRDVYVCPSDPQRQSTIVPRLAGFSYSQNINLGGSLGSADNRNYIPQLCYTLSQVKRTEITALFIEAGNWLGFYNPLFPTPFYSNHTLEFQYPFPFSVNHRGSGARPEGCSVSFVDGHAIFWNYAGDVIAEMQATQHSPDVLQMAAWAGAREIPPGVTP